jgi:hypothetical protein
MSIGQYGLISSVFNAEENMLSLHFQQLGVRRKALTGGAAQLQNAAASWPQTSTPKFRLRPPFPFVASFSGRHTVPGIQAPTA